MKVKTLLSLLLAVALCFAALCGCDTQPGSVDPTEIPAEPTAEPAAEPTAEPTEAPGDYSVTEYIEMTELIRFDVYDRGDIVTGAEPPDDMEQLCYVWTDESGCLGPQDFCVADGKLYLLDTYAYCIRVYDIESGEELRRISIEEYCSYGGSHIAALGDAIYFIGGDALYAVDASDNIGVAAALTDIEPDTRELTIDKTYVVDEKLYIKAYRSDEGEATFTLDGDALVEAQPPLWLAGQGGDGLAWSYLTYTDAEHTWQIQSGWLGVDVHPSYDVLGVQGDRLYMHFYHTEDESIRVFDPDQNQLFGGMLEFIIGDQYALAGFGADNNIKMADDGSIYMMCYYEDHAALCRLEIPALD